MLSEQSSAKAVLGQTEWNKLHEVLQQNWQQESRGFITFIFTELSSLTQLVHPIKRLLYVENATLYCEWRGWPHTQF